MRSIVSFEINKPASEALVMDVLQAFQKKRHISKLQKLNGQQFGEQIPAKTMLKIERLIRQSDLEADEDSLALPGEPVSLERLRQEVDKAEEGEGECFSEEEARIFFKMLKEGIV